MPAMISPDELVVALEHIRNPDHLMGITERLSEAMSAPTGKGEKHISTSSEILRSL